MNAIRYFFFVIFCRIPTFLRINKDATGGSRQEKGTHLNYHASKRHAHPFLSDCCQSFLEQSINITHCSSRAANWSKVDTRKQWLSKAAHKMWQFCSRANTKLDTRSVAPAQDFTPSSLRLIQICMNQIRSCDDLIMDQTSDCQIRIHETLVIQPGMSETLLS